VLKNLAGMVLEYANLLQEQLNVFMMIVEGRWQGTLLGAMGTAS